MIKWDNLQYDINKANRDFEKLTVKTTSVEPVDLPPEYHELRRKLIQARDELFVEYGFDNANKLDYNFDLTFGLELYNILAEEENFTNRAATNDDLWRYLSIRVIPDIVHSRWGMNEDHFYKMSRRIWLKTIWWYVNLSWRGNPEETYEILKNNSTDTILQLVERPGIGYYTEMYRELLLQYSWYEDKSREMFRQVLKLNTAQLLTTSPELVKGGIKGYVSTLFETVNK